MFADYSEDYLRSFIVTGWQGTLSVNQHDRPRRSSKGQPLIRVSCNYSLLEIFQREDAELYEAGMIVQTNPGTVPQRKQYLEDGKGVAVQSLWDDIQALSPTAAERIGYPTQKPVALLERVIRASTNEGDVVLGAFCGCGTTIVAAQRLGRSWIGMDITYQAIATILNRFEDEFPDFDTRNSIQDGLPTDMPSAFALANKRDDRVRKEFEK